MIKMTSKETIKEFEHLLKVEKDRIHKDVVFITALENAIEALEVMSKWIKCSDRMPEDETDVLVAVYGTDMLTVEDDSFRR